MRSFSSILYLVSLVLLAVAMAMPVTAQETDLTGNYPGFPGGLNPYFYSLPQLLAEDLTLRKMQLKFLDAFVDPDEYIVGPGDQFNVLFTANDISDLSGVVNPHGILSMKSIDPINLGHINLREAIDKITEEVKKNYFKAEVTIQLTGFRVVRIQVVGAVARPGVYYAPAIWRASEVITLAGGYLPEASTRHIVLHGFGNDYPVDMVKFNLLGDTKSNPIICRGNVVEIPFRKADQQFVSISGLVNRPVALEAVAGDNVSDVLALAGGARGNLEDMEIVISSVSNERINHLDGALSETADYQLAIGDNVQLVWKAGQEKHGTVAILGAVERPGRYLIPNNHFTLAELLEMCGGLSNKANSEMIQIYRKTMNQLADNSGNSIVADKSGGAVYAFAGKIATMNLVSLSPRNHWDMAEISITDGDSLFVPVATGMVSIEGAVVSPGLVPYKKGKGIDYYLQQAGGLGFDADRSRMVVINPLTNGKVDAATARELFDGEILLVPQKERSGKP